VHETVDVAGEPDEHAEVRDGLIWPDTLSPRLKFSENSFRGFCLHCLRPRLMATLFIHVQHHDFDFARVHDLGRVDVLVGPVHFGHVDQLDAVLDLTNAP
jgi:hypothetical protein